MSGHRKLFHSEEQAQAFFIALQKRLSCCQALSDFSGLVSLRKEEIAIHYPQHSQGNLASCFENPQVIAHIRKHPIADIPAHWHQIEIKAIDLFGSLPACWAAYERFRILARQQAGECLLSSQALPIDDESYQSEIVHRIETDNRRFYTLHSPMPFILSDAIALINLEVFIIEQKWYEMLYSLDLSQRGSHFLLYYTGDRNYPVLVSTALIQHWHERHHWLTFDPFFRGKGWQACCVHRYNIGHHLYQTGIFNKMIKMDHINFESESFTNECIENKGAICEILRFSTSGSSRLRFYYLYLGQKFLMRELINYGKFLSFTIIEQQGLLNFYNAISEDEACYFDRSFSKIEKKSTITYKGFLLNDVLRRALDKKDFNQYRALINKNKNKGSFSSSE